MAEARDADVVVCTWAGDDRELTLAAVRAAAREAGAGHVHVVDMSPDDRFAERLRGEAGVRVHWAPDSAGLGASRQIGLAHAQARLVAFLDSDALPRPGWLAALTGAVAEDGVAVSGGPVLPVWPSGRRVPALFRTAAAGAFLSMLDLGLHPLDVPRVLPGNMLVDRRETGEAVFATDLGRAGADLLGAEEIEMMVRVRARGGRLRYVPAAAVDHHTVPERLRWRWMWARVHAAGREAALHATALEPMPLPRGWRERAFLAAAAPAFLHGRHISGRRARRPRGGDGPTPPM